MRRRPAAARSRTRIGKAGYDRAVRKTTIIFATVLLTAAVAVTVAAATGTFSTRTARGTTARLTHGRPTIYVVGPSLRVRGTGFKSREHVRVSAKGALRSRPKSVTASSRGSFVAALGGGDVSCDSVTVIATGDRGSRASFNLSSFVCDR
jgi:hypothetical protein